MNSKHELSNNYQIAINIYQKRDEDNRKSIEENGFPIHPPSLVPQINICEWKEATKYCTEKNTDYHVMTYLDRSFYLYCDNQGKHWCYAKFGVQEHIEPYYY